MKQKIQSSKFNFTLFFGILAVLSFIFITNPTKVFALSNNGEFCQSSSDCVSNYCDTTNEVCETQPSAGNASSGTMVCLNNSQQQVNCSNGNPSYCNVNGTQVACPAQPNSGQMICLSSSQQQVDCNTGNPVYCGVDGSQVACPTQTTQSGSIPGSSTSGVAGQSCSAPGQQGSCNTGLVCCAGMIGNTCQAVSQCITNPSNSTNPATTNNSQPASSSPLACPSGLSNVNGICLPPNNFSSGIASSSSITDFLIKVINILLTLAGIVAVVVLIIGGFWYITSAGNEEQSEKGKKAIINAIIGLLVVVLAFAIVTVISNTVTSGSLSSGNVPTSSGN